MDRLPNILVLVMRGRSLDQQGLLNGVADVLLLCRTQLDNLGGEDPQCAARLLGMCWSLVDALMLMTCENLEAVLRLPGLWSTDEPL